VAFLKNISINNCRYDDMRRISHLRLSGDAHAQEQEEQILQMAENFLATDY